jgi:hypothetical protein
MKKKIYPRFYFVSNVALLDMLANGTNPPKIMKYLSDCYDSLANLSFMKNEDGTVSNKAVNEMVHHNPTDRAKACTRRHATFDQSGLTTGPPVYSCLC